MMDLAALHSTQPYTTTNALQASDAQSKLRLVLERTDDGDYQWTVERSTAGDVTVTFNATHINDASAPTIALLDVRRDHDGVNGAGMALFALSPGDKIHSISWDWDLTDAPNGTRAVWTYGEAPGPVTVTGTTKLVLEGHFCVGPSVHSHPSETADVGFYWFSQPDWDVLRLAEWTRVLFRYMQRFFYDNGSRYTVFMRASASLSGTGAAALWRSFMFGYSMGQRHNWESFQGLLAHEMVHNWPSLADADGEEVAWYVEGIADYYSVVLPFRCGIFGIDRVLQVVNNMDINPMVGLTDKEITAQSTDSELAEKVAYGRGLLFLATLDTQIRERSSGLRSIDNVVPSLLDRAGSGLSHDIDDFLNMVEQELGHCVRDEYRRMADGTLLVPPDGSLIPCLTVQRMELEQYEVGFEEKIVDSRVIVTDLAPNSRAAQAGFMDGDEVLWKDSRFSNPDVLAEYEDLNAERQFMVRRNGEQLSLSYRPRSFRTVEAYQWVKRTSEFA